MKQTLDARTFFQYVIPSVLSFCPVCNHRARIKLRQDTVIERLPLYCPKYRKEMIVNV